MWKNILLLGGTGTLSFAVFKYAVSLGYSVTVFNRGRNNQVFAGLVVKTIVGDFYDRESLVNASREQFDIVVDFLSRTPSDIERTYSVFRNACKQYIFISTACVFCRDKFPITEQSVKPNTEWDYNVQKYECELMLKRLQNGATSTYTIVRPYITYDDRRLPLGIAPAYEFHRTIIERIKSGKPMIVWDEGKAMSTVTHVLDFAIGVVGLFENSCAINEDFNIVGDYCYSGKEILLAIYESLKIKPNIVSIPTQDLASLLPVYAQMLTADRSLDAIFNNEKIKKAVPSFQPQIDLKKGLERVLHYYEKLATVQYDYVFDARIDKVVRKFGCKVSFFKYPGARINHFVAYYLFSCFSDKVAYKICRWLRIKL